MKNRRGGFTLIELIVSITILAVISGGIFSFLSTAIESWVQTTDEAGLVYEARQTMDRMVREIQMMTSVNVKTNTVFSFQNMDGDNVTFTKDGSNLYLSKGTTTNALMSDKLLSGEAGLVFVYFDGAGNPAAAAGDVRKVAITMTLSSGDSNLTLSSLARARNLS